MPHKDPEAKRAYMRDRHRRCAENMICVKCFKAPAGIGTQYCEPCRSKVAAKATSSTRRLREYFKPLVIGRYGGRCSCCGESNVKFLTIDHVNSDGATHRKTISPGQIWKWAVLNGYPDTLQLLCWNCNCGRAINGGVCPHKEEQE